MRDLAAAHLEGADLAAAHLEGAVLPVAHLEGAILGIAHLEGAVLADVHLEGAILRYAHLEGANLTAAHLEGANLTAAHLEGAVLGTAHLEGANLEKAHLEGADLAAAHLEGAVLPVAHLEGANLEKAHLEGANLTAAHLEGANLEKAHLEGTDLSYAHLYAASLTDSITSLIDLRGAEWRPLTPQEFEELQTTVAAIRNEKSRGNVLDRLKISITPALPSPHIDSCLIDAASPFSCGKQWLPDKLSSFQKELNIILNKISCRSTPIARSLFFARTPPQDARLNFKMHMAALFGDPQCTGVHGLRSDEKDEIRNAASADGKH